MRLTDESTEQEERLNIAKAKSYSPLCNNIRLNNSQHISKKDPIKINHKGPTLIGKNLAT